MNGHQWTEFAGLLLLETTVVVLIAGAAARLLRNPRARAVLWQVSFLALAVTLALRFSNLKFAVVAEDTRRSAQAKVLEPPQEPAAPQVSSQLSEAALPQRHELRWPFWVWLAGAALLLARIAHGHGRLRLALRRARPASPEIVALVEMLRARIAAPPTATVSWNELPTPCVSGIRRAILALPCNIETRVARTQLEAMLAHEIAHIAARDPFWNLASALVCSALWWNPAAWFARRALQNASELAADQASHCLPQGPAALAESLVILGRAISTERSRALPVLGGAGLRSGLGRRVQALLHDSPRWTPVRPIRAWLWRASALLAVIAVAAPLPHAQLPAPFWTLLAAPAEDPAASPAAASPPQTNAAATVSGILTDPQLRAVIHALENAGQKNPARDAHTADAPAEAGSVTISGVQTDPQLRQQNNQLSRNSAAPPAGTATIDTNKTVTLRFQIAEISEESPDLGLDWLFGKVREAEPLRLSNAPPYRIPGNAPVASTNILVEHLRFEEQFAILNSDQFSELLAALERQPGVDLLSAPMITTRSGRQAQISVMEMQTLVTGESASIAGTNTVPTEQVNFGVVVDVIPTAVGDSWVLPVVASYVEFLGYDAVNRKPAPRPRIRVRDATATAIAAPGETVVIRGVPVTSRRLVKTGFIRRDKIQEVRKRVYMFVTPQQPKN